MELNNVIETKNNNNVEVNKMEVKDNNMANRIEAMTQQYNNTANSAISGNANQRYAPLPEDPKARAFVFLDMGLKKLFDTLEFNQRVGWTEKESNILYGAGDSIMTKTLELEKLCNSLKQEKDIEEIKQQLEITPVSTIKVDFANNGKFKIIDIATGEKLFEETAETTKRIIEGMYRVQLKETQKEESTAVAEIEQE